MKYPSSLILIRHAESEANLMQKARHSDPEFVAFEEAYDKDASGNETQRLARLIGRRLAYPRGDWALEITELGRRQAYACAKVLKVEMDIPDIIFLSPYMRALQTYDAMREVWEGLPDHNDRGRVYQHPNLREIDMGDSALWGDWKLYFALHPKELERYKHLAGLVYFKFEGGGESVPQLMDRTQNVLDIIARDYSGKVVLIVSHHLTIQALRANIERWTLPHEFTEKSDGGRGINCAVTKYICNPHQGAAGRLVLEYANRNPHNL